jgi:hypothetical protein
MKVLSNDAGSAFENEQANDFHRSLCSVTRVGNTNGRALRSMKLSTPSGVCGNRVPSRRVYRAALREILAPEASAGWIVPAKTDRSKTLTKGVAASMKQPILNQKETNRRFHRLRERK